MAIRLFTLPRVNADPDGGTVDAMPDVPFGFSAGDDPNRDKPGENPGGGDFNIGDLGKIFTQLGQMFSGAGSSMAGGKAEPVNYDLARKLASSSIGFTAPVSESTRSHSQLNSESTRTSARLPAVIATGRAAPFKNPARSALIAALTSWAEHVPSIRSARAAQTRVACRRSSLS